MGRSERHRARRGTCLLPTGESEETKVKLREGAGVLEFEMDTPGRGTRDVWFSEHSGECMVCVCRVAGREKAREVRDSPIREGLCDTLRYSSCIPGTILRFLFQRDGYLCPCSGWTGGLAGRRETVKACFYSLALGMAVSFHSSTSQLKYLCLRMGPPAVPTIILHCRTIFIYHWLKWPVLFTGFCCLYPTRMKS